MNHGSLLTRNPEEPKAHFAKPDRSDAESLSQEEVEVRLDADGSGHRNVTLAILDSSIFDEGVQMRDYRKLFSERKDMYGISNWPKTMADGSRRNSAYFSANSRKWEPMNSTTHCRCGGNADRIEDGCAKWNFDLSEAIAEPLVLQVESRP